MKVGDYIVANYHDGREFTGTITLIENQSGKDGTIWGDGSNGSDRIMIRIRNEKGNYQSFWIDKCVSLDTIGA